MITIARHPERSEGGMLPGMPPSFYAQGDGRASAKGETGLLHGNGSRSGSTHSARASADLSFASE